MTVLKLAAIAVLALASLTSCAAPEQHATVADCVAWFADGLEARGTDPTTLIETGVLSSDCESKQAEMTVAEFDEMFLSDPTP